jgi:riboflavin-specific deaminase-like protein
MRRLLPEPAAEITSADLMEELRPWESAHPSRPHVYMNFAMTLDGQTTIDGVSRPIGSDRDTELLLCLRTRADALMIGAGTMRAERYGRVIADPAKREKRESLGLDPDPLMVVVSGRLDLPWDAPLFEAGAGRVVIFTASRDEAPQTNTELEIVRHEGRVDLPAALEHLRREHDVNALLCEGGASLHAELLKVGCVDEIFIAHAPKLAGGRGPGLADGLDPAVRELEVVWLAWEPETDELFARYRVNALQS